MNLFVPPIQTALSSTATVLSGAKLNFYETGTTTRQDTFKEDALSTAHANPVVADSAGRFAAIYLKDAVYKVVLTDSDDVELWTVDPHAPLTRLVGDTTPQLGGTLDANSKAINEAKGSDIASATTTDIGAAAGNYVEVTGTTTITGLGTVAAGTRRVVRFTGALTLTHNATSLILPTNANITTAAGDVAVFISLGSGNWLCTQYQRDTGAVLDPVQATQSAIEAETNENTYVPPDLIKHSPGVVKVRGQVDRSAGTPSLNSPSQNITSVGDDGAANTIVTIATDFSSTVYAVGASCADGTAGSKVGCTHTIAVGAFDVQMRDTDNTAQDTVSFSCWAMGDQA